MSTRRTCVELSLSQNDPRVYRGRPSGCRAGFERLLVMNTAIPIGTRDAVLGEGPMDALRAIIRNCLEPLKVLEAGHYVQEYGEDIAKKALEHFGI